MVHDLNLGTDIEAIEAHYLDKSPGWQTDHEQRLAIERLQRREDRESFQNFLTVWGLDAERVRQISEDTGDQCDFPPMVCKVQVQQSPIEGKGLFATGSFGPGEIIAPARISRKRTPAGRFVNHAKTPNAAMMARTNGDVDLVALRNITGCLGGQKGEEITVDYRHVMWTNLESQN